jgi:hypothetical protein
MSRISIPKRSIRTAVAGLIFVGLLLPANDAVAVVTDLPIGATADHASTVLTSHLPWLAPVGHRQPHQADVPRNEAVSAWERKQLQADHELDHKLIICSGC